MTATRSNKKANCLSLACCCASAACAVYYFVCGFADTFRLSILWVWLVGCVFFALAAFLFARASVCVFKGPLKTALGVFGALFALAALFFAFVEVNIARHLNDAATGALDCIIIPGAGVWDGEPSPYLRSRIETAYAYLADHPETIAVATGGLDPGESVTEADCIANYLLKKGISPERIIIEPRAGTTVENMRFSLALLPEGCERIGIATTDYHVYRSLVIARSCGGYEFCALAAPFHFVTKAHHCVREFATLVVDLFKGNIKPGALFV